MSHVQSCMFLCPLCRVCSISHFVMHFIGYWLSHDLDYLKPGHQKLREILIYSCVIVLAL